MTAHEFGMWGFSTLVWLFTVFSAVWGYHLVRDLIRDFKINALVQDLFVQDLLEGKVEIIEVEQNANEDDEDDYR